MRGDVATKGAKVTYFRTDTPIIVSGEDTLIEKSHLDRAIPIHLVTKHQNPEALAYFDYASPITRSYLEWLVRASHTRDPIPTQIMEFEEEVRLNDRQLRNLWVLNFGYNLLCEWLDDIKVNLEVPEIQWDQFVIRAEMEEHNNPLTAIIMWALEMNESKAVLSDEQYVYVHPVEFMRVVQSPAGPKTPLPFTNHRGLHMHLMDQMDGSNAEVANPAQNDSMMRVVQVPWDALDRDM